MRETLNRKIIGKMGAIRRKTITPKESGIGTLLNRLKTIDEALYIKLLDKYKTVLEEIK